MENADYRAILEGLLFASGDDGITIKQVANILELPESSIEDLLNELKYDYAHTHRGLMIMDSKNVYYLTTKPVHSKYYKKLLDAPRNTRMSQAALETLAIVAYKQPITRAEIDEIRGVKSDRSIQTLLARSLIEEVGRKEGIGRPILYATSKEFLTYFGLTSLEELPPLPEDINVDVEEKDADLFFEHFDS